MSNGLDFRILGPLEVKDGERPLRLGGAKQRSVLAILLLHAGEVVSVDRLIDELWADDPPEDAQTALHQHVSRLRRLLEPHRVIETRQPGYVVDPDGALDLHRFERLRDEGRAALGGGRAADASDRLREALGLWRGRPLADLEHEPFAREATRRLDEAWLDALESRIDADLALGRHAELAGELQALVRSHPLRERLRAQLMLALYRSGRQSEALDAYADARRTLVGELGLEPGPELRRLQRAILEHDAALELEAEPPPERPPRRRGLAVAVGLAVVVAAGAVAAAVLGRDAEPPRAAAARLGGELVAVDARTGRLERRIPVGRTPAAVSVGGGRAWLVDADARTVLAVDPASGAVETLATGATPTDIAAGDGSVWVANGEPLPDAQFIGPVATSVARIEMATRTPRAESSLPRTRTAVSNRVDNHVAVSPTAVWAVTPDFAVVRIDPATTAVTATSRAIEAVAVAAGGAGVWVLGTDGAVVRLDERTARVRARARVPATSATAIAVGADAAWVTSATDGTLWRIAGDRRPAVGAVDLEPGIADVAATRDGVWVVNPLAGTLVRVDAATSEAGAPVSLGAIPRSVAADDETVWVAVAGGAQTASTSDVAGVRPLPASMCEPVVAGAGGAADVLVVSDLPLQGGIRLSATQMAQAITFALRERGFRAGRFRVAYQSCDDSLARTGLYDQAKCAANARAYGADADVVGVIGTLNSDCAVSALPALNRAGLATVSPLNSFVGLTRQGDGVDPKLLPRLYPTGRRNYARVYPTDDLQGAALAMLARDLGHRRVFVLDDGDPMWGALVAGAFETAAGRLGLDVIGHETWDRRRRGYRDLARRVARAGPDAVFLGGILDTNGARVVKDLRATLDADVLTTDGFTPVPLFVEQAGGDARDVYISLMGVVTEHLPPAGAAFAERFARTQAGVPVEPSAIYAAQAATVLLDAIARSDGTRRSVVDELFRTRVTDGLLGSFRFDARGDISESPVTILRVREGGTSRTILSAEGATVERVVRPSPSLVAAG